MIVVLTDIIIYYLIMNFNTQFQMKNAKVKDHTQHEFGDLFLIIIIIIVLILKMMQNEVIKH